MCVYITNANAQGCCKPCGSTCSNPYGWFSDYLGRADISTTEVYARADNETKRMVLECAAERLQLPQATDRERDAGLVERLSSIG
ncbi:MAG: hypothetical protein M0R40_09270 [Firmicutes bacterium]|nr:hypothetical protein [Bacillota bacterium]